MLSRVEDQEYTRNQRAEKNLLNIVLVNLQVQVSTRNLRLLVIDKNHIENPAEDLNMRILLEKKGEQAKGLNREYM